MSTLSVFAWRGPDAQGPRERRLDLAIYAVLGHHGILVEKVNALNASDSVWGSPISGSARSRGAKKVFLEASGPYSFLSTLAMK